MIVLLASVCEEIGVWGATPCVDAHAREMEDVTAMVNLDGIASAYPSHREIWSAAAALLELAAGVPATLARRLAIEPAPLPPRVAA